MTALHFSPNGVDASPGDGTPAAPYRTVAKANAVLAALPAGVDELRFYGGHRFDDAVLTLSGLTFPAGFRITSYGPGRAQLGSADATQKAVYVNGTTGVEFDNIDVVRPVGAANESPNDGVAGFDLLSSTVTLTDVDVLGGGVGAHVRGTASVALLRRVTLRHQLTAGAICAGSGAVTFDDVTAQGSGYTEGYAAATATVGLGDALRVEGTVTVVMKSGAIVNPLRWAVRATQTANRATLYRLQTVLDRNDRTGGWLYSSSTAGLTVRDSGAKFLKTAGAGTFNHVEVAAGGKLKLANVSVIDDQRSATTDLIDHSGAELTLINCMFYLAHAHVAIRKQVGATAPVGTTNRYRLPSDGGYFPFVVDGVNTAYAAWATAYETLSASLDPVLDTPSAAGMNALRLADSSPLIGVGTDLSADYVSVPATDLFGSARSQTVGSGLWTQWSVGAHERLPATVQSFLEGGGVATLDSVTDVVSYASRRVLPPFAGFPLIDHEVSATVVPTLGMTRVGLWLLGGPVGGFSGTPDRPFSTTPYATAFAAGGSAALEAAGLWDVGRTPGSDDPRRVAFWLQPAAALPSLGNGIGAKLEASIPSGSDDTVNVTSTLGALPGVAYGQPVALRLAAQYAGPAATSSGGNGHRFRFTAYVGGTPVLTALEIVLPDGWVYGYGIAGASGPAGYAGLIGGRSTFGGALPLTSPTWDDFTGTVSGTAATLPLPSAPGGEARDQFFRALRGDVPNLCRNGGFTAHAGLYGANFAVRRLAGAVPVPSGAGGGVGGAADPALRAHLVVVLDGHDVPIGQFKNVLRPFLLDDCPDDGTVALTVIRHWYGAGSGGVFGNFDGLADVVVGPSRVRADNKAALADAVAAVPNQTFAGLAWTTALNRVVEVCGDGVPTLGGNPDAGGAKIVLFCNGSTPFENPDGTPAPVSHAAAVQAFLAIDGLVEASMFAFQADAADFSPTGPDNLFDVFHPTPPAYTQAAYDAGDTSIALARSDVGLSGLQAALAATVSRRVAEWAAADVGETGVVVSAGVPEAPVGAAHVSAYESWPDPFAGWAATVDVAPAEESPLGAWSLSGVRASAEIPPRDADPTHWSFDGGNLLRLALIGDGALTMRQIAEDPRPLRGRWLTLAYSGASFGRGAQVELAVWLDGERRTLLSEYSSAFGRRTRRTASLKVPKNVREIAFGLVVSGRAGAGVAVSGFVCALGRYDFDLPYSESALDRALPPGAVVLHVGPTCPPGYMRVDGVDGRLLYATSGDPGFHRREFLEPPSAAAEDPHDVDVDAVCVVNTQSGQASQAALVTNVAWIEELLLRRLPRNGRVRVSVVAGNGAAPGATVLAPTVLRPSATASIAAALSTLTPASSAFGFGAVAGPAVAANLLAAASLAAAGAARKRVVFVNVGADVALTDSGTVAAVAALHAVPRLSFVTVVAVGATLAAVRAAGAETLAYPAPASDAPGTLFAATGGAPGSAAANFWSGQPFLAGVYAAATMAAEVGALLETVDEEKDAGRGSARLDPLGGSETHDHLGSTDAFDAASDAEAVTSAPIPTTDQAVARGYPFGYYSAKRRPEDPPVSAIGVAHTHAVRTDMTALPPAFPLRVCLKL